MSGAKVGDKTMMDALIPASQAIAAYSGSDEAGLFDAAAQAALQGAEASKQFVSKFGRAKSYGEQTIGTPRMPGPPPWPISSRGWHGPERISIDFEREVLHI